MRYSLAGDVAGDWMLPVWLPDVNQASLLGLGRTPFMPSLGVAIDKQSEFRYTNGGVDKTCAQVSQFLVASAHSGNYNKIECFMAHFWDAMAFASGERNCERSEG